MRTWLNLLLSASILTASVSCRKQERKGGPSAVPVTVAKAASRDFPIELAAVGAAEAVSTVSIKAQAGGELVGVHFQEGQDVDEGTLLFTIDPRPYRAAVAQAEANLAKDEAQHTNARVQLERATRLVGPGVVSKEQYDQAVANHRALAATLVADRANVVNARLQLSYCWIRAPLAGRTGPLLTHKGNVIKANDTTGLVVINTIHPIYVSFTLPEQNLSELQTNMAKGPLTVQAWPGGAKGEPVEGTVTFLDNQVDQNTGTIRLKATFANADERLWPGLFVRVAVKLKTVPGAVVVPSAAIQRGQPGTYVFVVGPQQQAELRKLRAGAESGGDTLVEEGLHPGELVVTDGQMRLVPGARVSIKNAPLAEGQR